MRVQVSPYDPQWPEHFAQIASELRGLLQSSYLSEGTAATAAAAEILSIEHVGSTSVPGLAAKPIIDIDIVVASRAHVAPVINAICSPGTGYKSLGEMGIPDRFCLKSWSLVPARNVYAVVAGSTALENHLRVRDVLREDDELRDEYGAVKLRLAEQEWESVDEYCEAKNEVLQKVLTRAGMDEESREAVKRVNVLANAQQDGKRN